MKVIEKLKISYIDFAKISTLFFRNFPGILYIPAVFIFWTFFMIFTSFLSVVLLS